MEEIDSHANVIELDMPINPAPMEGQMPPSTLPNPYQQTTIGIPLNPLKHTPDPEA